MSAPGPHGRRPPSPFLRLLLGGAVSALATEWLRFQDGWAVAAPVALLGAALTTATVARAYRARRRWRRGVQLLGAEDLPAPGPDEGPPGQVRIRTAEAEAEAPASAPKSRAPNRSATATPVGAAEGDRPPARRSDEPVDRTRGPVESDATSR